MSAKKLFRHRSSDRALLGEKPSDERTSDHKSVQGTTGRRGSLQLWQFLVALLDTPDASAGCIAWTGRGMEFKLIEPEEVVRIGKTGASV